MGDHLVTSKIREKFHASFVQNQMIPQAFVGGNVFDFEQNKREIIDIMSKKLRA